MPTTARNQRGGVPVISVRMRCVSAISRRMRDGPSAQNQRAGWEQLWLPMPWPRRRISRTSSGRCAARSPTRKNVAFASCASSASRIGRVSSDGPSSMVSQTRLSSTGRRFSTGPYTAECGHRMPHQNGAWLATIAGRPTVQPQRHQISRKATCDSARNTIQACGLRGTRCNSPGTGASKEASSRTSGGLAERSVIAA